MEHKTIVGGTQYNVKKGKALVGGTEYSVKKGKTLVDSTVYEVGFAPSIVTITITTNAVGAVTDSCAIITVKGYGTYSATTNATYDLIVPIGTEIEFTVKSNSATESVITVNRLKVASAAKDGGPVSYTYIVNSNATMTARSLMNSQGSIVFTDDSLNPESTMTVTRQGSSGWNGFVGGFYLEYNAPSGTSESELYAGQRTVSTGTLVTCWINTKAGATSQIIVNGIVVKSGTGSYEEYSFQVSGNITIDIRNYDTYGVITITK